MLWRGFGGDCKFVLGGGVGVFGNLGWVGLTEERQ